MKSYNVTSMNEILDIIGAGCIDLSDHGPVVTRIDTWFGVSILGRYGIKPTEGKFLVGDVETKEDIFFEIELLRPFLQKLLDTGKSFFTVTGTHDMVCSLEWCLVSKL